MSSQKLKRAIFVYAALIFAAACNPIGDYDFFSTVQGVVSDYHTGEPVPGATIMIMPGSQTAMTDQDGRFEFADLDPKQYTLTVQKDGYQTNRKIVDAVSGETVQAVITLNRVPE